MLEANQNSAEWQAFINSLTTNLTAFFREAHHFPGGTRPPPWRRVSRLERGGLYRGRAVLAGHHLADTGMAPGRWKVYASDIDTEVLEKPVTAFIADELKTLSPQQLQRYFMRGTGPHEGLVRVRRAGELRGICPVNLLDKQYNVPGPFDAIFVVT